MIKEITKGNWYMCLEDFGDTEPLTGCWLECRKGFIYKCYPFDGWLVDHHNCMFGVPMRKYKYLRLATKEEIKNKHIHGSPNL